MKLFNNNILFHECINNTIDKDIKKIIEKVKEKKIKNIKCKCKRSKCLKNYCECFSNGKYCDNCKCNNCLNNENNIQKIEKIKQILYIKSQSKNLNNSNEIICKCTKNNCQKKYCECYKNKTICNKMCKCISCKNIEKNESLQNISFKLNELNYVNHKRERQNKKYSNI